MGSLLSCHSVVMISCIEHTYDLHVALLFDVSMELSFLKLLMFVSLLWIVKQLWGC